VNHVEGDNDIDVVCEYPAEYCIILIRTNKQVSIAQYAAMSKPKMA